MRIPIASMKVYDWQGPTTGVKFRVVANQSFLARDDDDTGFQVDAGVFREVDCTFAVEVIDGVNVKVLTVPVLWLFSTTDAIVNRQARYSAFYYRSGGKVRDASQLQSFQVPKSIIDVFNPVPWSEIIRYNNPAAPIPFDVSTFSREQILQLLGGGAINKGSQAASPRVAFWSGPITINGAQDWEYQDADPQVVLRSRNVAWNTHKVVQSAASPNTKVNNKPSLHTMQTVNHTTFWNQTLVNDAATFRWGMSVRDGATGLHLEAFDSSPALAQGFRFDPAGGLGLYDELGVDVGYFHKGAAGFYHLGINAAGGDAIAATKELTFTTSGVGINKSSAIGSQLHVVSGAAGRIGFIVDTAASPSQPIATLRNNGNQRFLFNHDGVAEFGLASSVKGRLTFAVATGVNKTSLEAADTPASSVVYKMPANDPGAGQLLRTLTFAGGVATLEWVNPTAGGDVSSDIGTVVDNKMARFQGTTGKLITDSAITVADTTGNFTVPNGWQVTNAGGSIWSLNQFGSVFTAPAGAQLSFNGFEFILGAQSQSSTDVHNHILRTTYNQSGTAGSDDIVIQRTDTAVGSGQHNFIRGLMGAAGNTLAFRIDRIGNYFFGFTNSHFGDHNGNPILRFDGVTSAVNALHVANAATGNAPELASSGSDTNIPLRLAGKGNEYVFAHQWLKIQDVATPHIRFVRTNATARTVDVGIDNADGFGIFIAAVGTPWLINMGTLVTSFSAIPVLPASNPTTANQAVRKQYVDDRKTWWSMNWFIADPTTFPINSFNLCQKAKIPSNNFVATGCTFIANTGTASGSYTISIRKHIPGNQLSQTIISTTTINPGTIGAETFVDFADHAFSIGDFLYPILDSISSPAQRDINISVFGYQTSTA